MPHKNQKDRVNPVFNLLTTWRYLQMIAKPTTALLSLSFLVLVSAQAYGDDTTTQPVYKNEGGTSVHMDGLTLIYKTPTKEIKAQITSVPTGISSILVAPAALFSK